MGPELIRAVLIAALLVSSCAGTGRSFWDEFWDDTWEDYYSWREFDPDRVSDDERIVVGRIFAEEYGKNLTEICLADLSLYPSYENLTIELDQSGVIALAAQGKEVRLRRILCREDERSIPVFQHRFGSVSWEINERAKISDFGTLRVVVREIKEPDQLVVKPARPGVIPRLKAAPGASVKRRMAIGMANAMLGPQPERIHEITHQMKIEHERGWLDQTRDYDWAAELTRHDARVSLGGYETGYPKGIPFIDPDKETP